MVSWVQTKNGSYHYTFALSPFLFFPFFLSKCAALDHLLVITIHHDHSLAPPLGMDYPLLSIHLALGLVHRFHQLSKTKLGLSISLFLVIDDNLSQRYSMKSFWIHVACPSILPCVKDMDKFHEPELVALAPPTYVL